jgi:WD40 repeat protein
VGGLDDDLRLVTGSDAGTLTDISFGVRRDRVVLSGHTRAVTGCIATPDAAHVVSWSLDRTLKLWDLDESTCVGTIYGHAPFIAVAVLSMGDPRRQLSSESEDVPESAVCRLAALDASGMVWLIDARIPLQRRRGSTAAT